MQATAVRTEKIQKLADQYLGFEIQDQGDSYQATPMGWTGEILDAETLPQLRRKIWRWWHQVQ
jgi:hypothetical protein